jgi:hypothetical protein
MSDPEIKVLLTADQAQLQAGMEQGAASVKASTEQMQATIAEEAAAFNAAVQAKIDAQVRLNAAFAGGITSTEGIASAEAALDQAMTVGAITTTEYAAHVATLDAAEVALAGSTAAATAATVENTAAQISSRTAYSASALITDALTGQFSRSRREVAALANETGLLQAAFNSVGPAVLGVTAIVAGLTIALKENAQEQFELERSIIATNGYIGLTASEIENMANKLTSSEVSIGQARDALAQLAASGRVSGQDLQSAGVLAVNMAAITGESMNKAVADVVALEKDPVKAINNLQDRFHLLTTAQRDNIQALLDAKDPSAAVRQAMDDMGVAAAGLTGKLKEVDHWYDDFAAKWKAGVSNLSADIFGSVNLSPLEEKFNKASAIYNGLKQAMAKGSTEVNVEGQWLPIEQALELARQKAYALQQQIIATRKEATQQGAVAPLTKPGRDDTGALAADDKQLFQEMQLNRTMSLESERAYWQAKRDAATAGTKEYEQAVQQILEIKNKEAAASKAAGRKEATAAREAARTQVQAAKKAAAEQMNTLEMVRAGTAANTAERIQADAAVLASATRLYGANSTQQKSALAQMLSDEKAYDAAKQRLSLENLKASHDHATKDLDNKRQAYQLEYSEGKINAQQLLQLEDDLATQKLAIDTKYYQNKAKLDAGDVVAVAKDNAAIVTAKQDAQAKMLTNEKEFHKNSEKEWNDYAKKVEGSIQSQTNAIIFQHQTLGKALANIGMTIGEDFVQNVVMKPLNKFIEGEAEKIAKATATQTTMQAQQAANSAAEAARNVASVTRASGVAGAMGTASFAGAPWPIDLGAPAFGAGMAAAAMGYASVASAAGGWERVPADGMMTELHRDEMVLPKHVADPMRQMAKSGGNGGGVTHNHFHSFDSHGIANYARRHPDELAKAMKHVAKRGHLR